MKLLYHLILLPYFMLSLLVTTTHSEEKNSVTWATEAFTPFYISEGEEKGNGSVDELLNLLEDEMSDFEHKRQFIPILRIIEELKANDQIACASFLFDPNTTNFAQYSEPLFAVPPQELVIKRSAWLELGSPKSISLENVLSTGHFSLGLGQGRNYGKKLTKIIERFKHDNPKLYYRVGDHFNGLADMIILNRIDATIAYSGEVNFFLSQPGKADTLVHLPIEENNEALLVYVIAPKSEWGDAFLKRVNKAIDRVRLRPEYIKAIDRWFDHTSEFDETLQKLINNSKLQLKTE